MILKHLPRPHFVFLPLWSDTEPVMTAIRALGRTKQRREPDLRYSQLFQGSQAIEGAIPQQGDLVVAQVSAKT